jgi:hypothetical protein
MAPRTGTITSEKVRETMTNAEKRDRIRESLAAHPDWSNRQHASAVGVTHNLVGKVRAAESTRLDLHGFQAQQQRAEEESEALEDLVVDMVDGRLVAAVDLVVERADLGPSSGTFIAGGDPVPPELADLPRRPAG